MDKLILKDLFLKYWKYAVILILLIVIYFLFNQTQSLEAKVINAVEKAKEHEIKAQFYLDIYHLQMERDAVLESKYDSLLLEKNKFKIQYNEKIKYINRFTVSDWQQFYNERATKGSNP